MAFLARFALALVLAVSGFASRAADPVAFVSDVKGDVSLDGKGRPAFLTELLPGSRLILGDQASASVMYVVSGSEYGLLGPGEFVVARDAVTAAKGAAPVRRTPPLRPSTTVLVQTSKAAMASLRMRGALAPRPDAAVSPYPAGGKISTLQPTLRWPGEASQTYAVVVSSSSGKEVYRGSVKGTSLRIPAKLVAGQAYSWSYATAGAAPGDARFETLAADAMLAAEKARGIAKSFPDRVLLALLLEDLGASQESRQVWAQLAAERPDLPELAGLARP